MARGQLTVPIAKLFIRCGHAELSEAVAALDLFAAMRPGPGFLPRHRGI
jgi:hypothetical protein